MPGAADVIEWLNLAVRWMHVIAAIMWIGSSLFFNWLDARIEVNERTKEKKIEGELWMVHSGGFYEVQKTLIAPTVMPKKLHWFKWEAGFTLLTGWLLLDIVFFQGGGVTLVDPNVSSISPAAATALVVTLLVCSWFIYDLFWRSRYASNLYVGILATYGYIVFVLHWLSGVLSGRAAYLVTGAMMATWMATNVWVHIIPAQQGLVDAVTAGRKPEEHLAKHAKTRSRHNNYMTYPVVLIMLSNHFAGLYGHKLNWAILAVLIVAGALVRHVQNVFKELNPHILVGILFAILAYAVYTDLRAPSAETTERLNLVVRWMHVIAAIMWIGSSLFFNWLDARIEVNERTKARGIEGELWMVHSGGFYLVEKTLVAPKVMPKKLHWFKWEAGFTLLTGWLLLYIVFFMGGATLLVDPNVGWSSGKSIHVVLALLIGSWFVYDLFWRSPLAKNVAVGAVVTYAFVVGVLWWLSHHVNGRAAYLVTGAMMGTWMATNVWVHIIPAQKGLVTAVTAGNKPEERLAKHAKMRSRHNNYMTYPVVLVMLSNHFPGFYGHTHNWVILGVLIVIGASIRHLQNTYKELHPALLLTALACLLMVAHSVLTTEGTGTASAADDKTPLSPTDPSPFGGPSKVANEAIVGTINVTVLLEGTPPPNKRLELGTCTTENKGPVFADTVVVDERHQLKNAFVWIKKGLESYKAPSKPSEPVVLDQNGCMYTPHVVGAQTGQKVVFLNSDPVLHNVRTITEANPTFNEMMQTKDTRLVKTFEKAEVPVRAKCDVHPWMSAFVGVVPHPFFAVSTKHGDAILQNVPEGEYEIEAWHEAFGRETKKVTVKARQSVNVTFTFRAE